MRTSTANLVFRWCLSFGVTVLASSLVFAATANVGGTLKSVAASGKTITVTVGTGSSAKTESFSVTAGTKITLDDKPAKLSELKPGSKVSISYDKSSKDAASIQAHSAMADRPQSELSVTDTSAKVSVTTSTTPDFSGVIRTRKLSPVSGRRAVLAILWDPHRMGHSAPPAKMIDDLLFGARPSVADWFSENSGSALTIEKAGLLGWYDADKPPDHYWSTSEKTDPNDRDGDGWLNVKEGDDQLTLWPRNCGRHQGQVRLEIDGVESCMEVRSRVRPTWGLAIWTAFKVLLVGVATTVLAVRRGPPSETMLMMVPFSTRNSRRR